MSSPGEKWGDRGKYFVVYTFHQCVHAIRCTIISAQNIKTIDATRVKVDRGRGGACIKSPDEENSLNIGYLHIPRMSETFS